jgi:O-acetyl-ADP-ribose deacetylase (regulator of RNase III)
MAVQILQGNALDARADALVLTIDGARRGMEGNIARAFARRWPDAFEEIEEQIRYPIPLGRTVATHPESDCPFRTVLFASTLHHLDVLTDTQKSAIIANALTEAVNLALKHRCRSVATAVMSGGWRLPFDTALSAMLSALAPHASRETLPAVLIYVLTQRDWFRAKEIMAERGP